MRIFNFRDKIFLQHRLFGSYLEANLTLMTQASIHIFCLCVTISRLIQLLQIEVNQRFGQNPFLFGCNCQLLFSPDLKTSKSKIDEKCQNRVFLRLDSTTVGLIFVLIPTAEMILMLMMMILVCSGLSFKVTKPSVHLANKQQLTSNKIVSLVLLSHDSVKIANKQCQVQATTEALLQ